MKDKRLSIHHVGGRAGSRAFPHLPRFERDMINVLYDADPDCIEQIKDNNQCFESELYVLPYCLADARKRAYFNINYDPFTSSLMDLNPEYESYYYFATDLDYPLSEVMQTMEKRQVDLLTLDYIFQSKAVSIPPPDFLSLDVQGSEYEILKGATDTLKLNVVGLILETEFHPIYKGQKVFGDLAKFLNDEGFFFVRFFGLTELSPVRAPIGLRGEGFQTSTDALFLRRIDHVVMNAGCDVAACQIMLGKLAFIAIIFNQFEYALQCLHARKHLFGDRETLGEQEELSYLRFLAEIEGEVEKVPKVFPRSFVSKYTFDASKSRFDSSDNSRREMTSRARIQYSLGRLVRSSPVLLSVVKKGRQFVRRSRGLFVKIWFNLRIEFGSVGRYRGVETVLVKYGLKTQAQLLRRNRIIQSRFVARHN